MPLIISGCRVSTTPTDIKQFVSSHPALKEATLKLRDTPSRMVGPEGLLYVCQQEYAVVPTLAKNIHVLGADDATTCHILLMKHSGSGTACIAHLDGSKTAKSIRQMFTKLKQLSRGSPEGRFEVHIAGGFLDSRHISVKLSFEIIGALMTIPEEIHLVTACISDWNDTLKGSTHFPIIYGLAYELKTGALYPATFHDKGPDVSIRCASHFGSGSEPVDVFHNNQLVVGPFQWHVSSDAVNYYLSMPDEYFRQNWSTSPEQEPDHFAEHVRMELLVLRDHPEPLRTLFPDSRPRLYRKQTNGHWIPSE